MPVPEAMVPSALGWEGDAVVFEELLFVLSACELEFVFFENLQPNRTAASSIRETNASLLLIDTGFSLLCGFDVLRQELAVIPDDYYSGKGPPANAGGSDRTSISFEREPRA
jgi:hypothetical protein